jgi:hypothetical protein
MEQMSPYKTHILTIFTLPNCGGKYKTICNLLQAGVTIIETLDITNPEETPKDIILLLQFISVRGHWL